MSESSSAVPAGPAPDRIPGSPSGLEQAAASRTLVEMIIGFQVSRAIGVAAELGIADLLAEGSLSVEQLAALTNTRAPLLYRMLRALASRGIFAELEDGRFAMTPLADRLRSSAPRGLGACLRRLRRPGFRATAVGADARDAAHRTAGI
jgi:hypothetical protein